MAIDKDITALVRQRARSFAAIETPLAESHGERAIDSLLSLCSNWRTAPAAFEELARYPQALRRQRVHGELARLAARLFGDEPDPDDSGMAAEKLVNFIVDELADAPELAETVFGVIGRDVVAARNATKHLIALAERARHRAALPSLSGLWSSEYHWAAAVLSIDGGEAALDEVLEALAAKRARSRDLPLCLALLAPDIARETLLPRLSRDRDGTHIALGFLAHPDDAERFEGRDPSSKHARRLFVAQRDPSSKKRVAAMKQAMDDYINLGGRLLMAKLLCDADEHVAITAAHLLCSYVEAFKSNAQRQHELFVLRSIETLAARGVDDALWSQLKKLRRTIAHGPQLPRRERPRGDGAADAHEPPQSPAALTSAQTLAQLLLEVARLSSSEEDSAVLTGPRLRAHDDGTLLSVAGSAYIVDADGERLRECAADGTVAGNARRKRVATVCAKLEQQLEQMRAQIVAAERLAGCLTRIAKLESELGEGDRFHEDYSEAKVTRREKLLLIDRTRIGRLIVRRKSGAVCAVASYGKPGRTRYRSLEQAVAEHEARIRELERRLAGDAD